MFSTNLTSKTYIVCFTDTSDLLLAYLHGNVTFILEELVGF